MAGALEKYFPADFKYTPEEVAGVWAEGANDPDGWNALLNTYAALGAGSVQRGLREYSSAVRQRDPQFVRAFEQADKFNAFERRRMQELAGVMSRFTPDVSWPYTNHESPDLYVDRARANGMAPRPYMERVLKNKWRDVDFGTGKQFGRQVYYKKKIESANNTGRSDVAELQRVLNTALGGYIIKEDGKLGPKTERALRAVQRRYGLKPDGIIGPKTKSVLDRFRR